MPDTNDADLRKLFVAAFCESLPSDSCPEPEELFDAYHKQVTPERLNELLDHLAVCPVCADAWRLASRTEADV